MKTEVRTLAEEIGVKAIVTIEKAVGEEVTEEVALHAWRRMCPHQRREIILAYCHLKSFTN